MSRPRKRYCPHGHDKDAPGGSYWSKTKTLKGTLVWQRVCRECHKYTLRAAYWLRVLGLRPRTSPSPRPTQQRGDAPP